MQIERKDQTPGDSTCQQADQQHSHDSANSESESVHERQMSLGTIAAEFVGQERVLFYHGFILT